jgi:3-deoxy-D-manno-octulosonic-acid transferase
MENFRDMSRIFVEQGAAMQVDKPGQLAPMIHALLSNTEKSFELGERALAVVQQNTGATDRVLGVLKPAEAGR